MLLQNYLLISMLAVLSIVERSFLILSNSLSERSFILSLALLYLSSRLPNILRRGDINDKTNVEGISTADANIL